MNFTKILKIILFIGITCTLIMLFVYKKHPRSRDIMNKYQIVYLNGPSSVGKSTLARQLQNKLNAPFLLLGIDQIIFMMPEKMNDWHNETLAPGFSWQSVKNDADEITAYKIRTGPYGEKMIQTLKDIVIALARTGHNIIIDDVSFGKKQVNAWKEALEPFKVLWVGLIAPLEIIQQREKQRGDRKLNSAKWQAEHVHVGVEYDLMLDTHAHILENNIDILYKKINP